MNLPSRSQRRFGDSRHLSQGRWSVLSAVPRWRQAAGPLLIGISLVLSFQSAAAHAAGIDYTPFYGAIHAGNTGTALSTGQDLYTRLAFQAEGREPFYRMGITLVAIRQAADYVVQLHADPGRSGARCRRPLCGAPSGGGTASGCGLRRGRTGRLPAGLPAPVCMPSTGTDADRRERGPFGLGCQCHRDGRSPGAVAGDARRGGDDESAGCRASRSLDRRTRAKPTGDCPGGGARAALGGLRGEPGRLAQTPADPEARKELLELVGQLCKAQRIQEALALCDWARDITRDSAYGSVLLLQQAIIAARDQENPGLAIRLCDQVAAAAGETATIQLARHLAAVYCLSQE